MISRAELQYVNAYARFAPYPGDEYAMNVMNSLLETHKLFLDNYNEKRYSLILSNGEEIEFEILSKNLAHMLGLDFQNLRSEPMECTMQDVLGFYPYNRPSSIEILNRIIERAEDVVKNDSNPSNYKILNYYKVMIKCAIFSKLSNFSNFDFGCINFSKDTYEKSVGETFSPQSTKFFFTPSDEALTPYFMMGIKKVEDESIYIPETLFASLDYWKFFCGQELVLPVQILINDRQNLSKLQATNEEKINLLNMYKSIITTNNTGSYINIFNDYQNMLMENKEKKLVR